MRIMFFVFEVGSAVGPRWVVTAVVGTAAHQMGPGVVWEERRMPRARRMGPPGRPVPLMDVIWEIRPSSCVKKSAVSCGYAVLRDSYPDIPGQFTSWT